MQFQEILTELKKPFTPEDHKERKLPGGGRWSLFRGNASKKGWI